MSEIIPEPAILGAQGRQSDAEPSAARDPIWTCDIREVERLAEEVGWDDVIYRLGGADQRLTEEEGERFGDELSDLYFEAYDDWLRPVLQRMWWAREGMHGTKWEFPGGFVEDSAVDDMFRAVVDLAFHAGWLARHRRGEPKTAQTSS